MKYHQLKDCFPAINVRLRNWVYEDPLEPRLTPYLWIALDKHPEIFDSVFSQVSDIWWSETVKEIAEQCDFLPNLVNQAGRSGGWLIYRDRLLGEQIAKHGDGGDEDHTPLDVQSWMSFVDMVEVSLAHAAEDMRLEVAHWIAEMLDEERDEAIEEWDAHHPRYSTRRASDDPCFGFMRLGHDDDPAAACRACKGWGWLGPAPHAEHKPTMGMDFEPVPCPRCAYGRNLAKPRWGIDVPARTWSIPAETETGESQ